MGKKIFQNKVLFLLYSKVYAILSTHRRWVTYRLPANLFAVFLLFALLFFFAFYANAHGDEIEETKQISEPVDYLPLDPFFLAFNVFALVLVLSAISLFFQSWMTEKTKKFFFIIVAFTVVTTTLYAAGSTVYLNLVSASGGPVHWHADYEVWICKEHFLDFKEPEFLSNYIGTPVFHNHNDYRMHVEGIVVKLEDISLGNFFKALGGDFDGHSLTIIKKDDSKKTVIDGELCPDGKPGKWKLFVKNHQTGEFEENFDRQNYAIKPFFNVPPGDFLKLVFDSTEGVPNGG